MKNYKRVLASSCAILCLAAFTACGNKTDKVLELIDSGDYSAALDYYEDKIDGSNKERDIRKEIKKGMKERYEDVLEKFGNDEISEKEMDKFFELMKELKIDDDDDDYSKFFSKYHTLVLSKEYYSQGLDLLESGDYEEAIYYFEMVDEADGNYKKAQDKLKEAQDAIADEQLQVAQDYIDGKEYTRALNYLRNYESELSDNEKFAKMKKDAETGLVSQAKEKVEEYFGEGEYYDAYYYLNDLTSYNIKEIQTMFDGILDDYVDYTIEAAGKKADDEDYEGAVKLIEDAMYYADDNDKLSGLYDEYKAYIPVYITEMDYLSANGSIYRISKDNTGAEHKSGMKIDGWGTEEYSAEYLLDGKYNIFSGQVGVDFNERSSDDSKYFEIYGDDKLLYTSPTMTKESLPQDFILNVTDIKRLKIVYPATEGSNSLAVLFDGLFTKADTKGIEFTTQQTEETETETEAASESESEEETTSADTTTAEEEETTAAETTTAAEEETTAAETTTKAQ